MKKSFLSKVLAVLVAVSLTTTAFASSVTVIKSNGKEKDYNDIQVAASKATPGSTVRLNENADVTIDATNYINVVGVSLKGGVTLDLHNYELNLVVTNADKLNRENHAHGGHIAAVGIGDNAEGRGETTIQGGTINVKVDKPSEDTDVYGVWSNQGTDVRVEDTDIAATEGTTLTAGIGTASINSGGNNDSTVTVENSTVTGAKTAVEVKDEASKTIIKSGVFENLETDDKNVVLDKENESKKLDVSAAEGTTIIGSKDTAAVVVDKDGKATLYNDLEKAAEAVGDGATVNVVDKALKAPDGFEIKDGVLSKVEKVEEPVNPNPITPVEPVTPVTPVFPEVMDLAAGGSSTEIADEETPLAGLITRGELVSYLYVHEGSPDGEDAEGEYVKAMAWAVAQEIVAEDDDPEEVVTGAILRGVMTAYAELLDTTFDVEVDVEDDAPVMNCDELLTAFFEAQEARTK